MSLDPILLEVLACPQDKGPLLYVEDEQRLYNPRLRRSYPVREGIPVMLVEEAEAVDPAEHDRLMGKAERGEARWTLQGQGPVGEAG
ncbi:Trm112 family protein [Aciditerrimonas ferrireducens]|uniref:UPF0434 protein ACFFRE_08435 n=1 Tax=Aciditerrimonas ferrireducens TaxID=667306 RepID=A0ABV6C3B1_9ACTN